MSYDAAYKQGYDAAHREEVRAYNREYHRTHPRDRRATNAAWYAAHREADLAANAAWRKANPDKRHAAEHRRRAAMKGNGTYTVLPRDWRRTLHRYRNACAYCGARAELQQEHVFPISRGGRHAIGNLLPSCMTCNVRKNARLLIEWRAIHAPSEGALA